MVKGSGYGFVVTGTDAAGNYLAYASTGSTNASLPTGSLGVAASYASAPAATVGPGGIVIAAGSAATTTTGQQAILLRASTAGAVQPVLPGVAIPQWRSTAWPWPAVSRSPWAAPTATPAIWHKTAGGAWRLVSSLSLVSANPGQAALTSVTHGPAGWPSAPRPGRPHLLGSYRP